MFTFQRMWSGSLFKEDGVFIHAGLYVMSVSQWFIVILYIILYASVDLDIQSAYRPVPNAPSMAPSPTAIESPTVSPASLPWFPTEAKVRLAIRVGCLCAIIAAACLDSFQCLHHPAVLLRFDRQPLLPVIPRILQCTRCYLNPVGFNLLGILVLFFVHLDHCWKN